MQIYWIASRLLGVITYEFFNDTDFCVIDVIIPDVQMRQQGDLECQSLLHWVRAGMMMLKGRWTESLYFGDANLSTLVTVSCDKESTKHHYYINQY